MSPDRAPNILLFMADQLTPFALPFYAQRAALAPNLSAMAEEGTTFESFYCNSPICAPARSALMTGQLCSTIGAWDNASELPSTRPTIAHYLRVRGYRTCLSGKMHFVGPDQLHGFEERLTTDICPANFDWAQNWDRPYFNAPYHHNMENVARAGIAERSLQQDYDYDVSYSASRWIYDHARHGRERPFFLCASFTHPHDPYVTPRRFWSLYDEDDIPMPSVLFEGDEMPAGHDRRHYEHCDRGEFDIKECDIRAARRAYFGSVSYLDERVGEILSALRGTRLLDDTILVFTSDHGDMLGERGHWYKMTFYEWSARIPLVLSGPGLPRGRREGRIASQVDLLPTLLELAGGAADADLVEPIEGSSLVPALRDSSPARCGLAIGELFHDVVPAPYVMVRKNRFKYLQCEYYAPCLFDLASDPNETSDLAGQPRFRDTVHDMAAEITRRYDVLELKQRIVADQRRRRLIAGSLKIGKKRSWDFQPFVDASTQYYRDPVSYHLDEKRNLL